MTDLPYLSPNARRVLVVLFEAAQQGRAPSVQEVRAAAGLGNASPTLRMLQRHGLASHDARWRWVIAPQARALMELGAAVGRSLRLAQQTGGRDV